MRHLLPALLVSLVGCGTTQPPASPPQPAAPAVPTAAAPAAALPPLIDEALARVLALLADPNNDAVINATFSPTFLAAVPIEKVKAVLVSVTRDVGACKDRRPVEMNLKSDTAAQVRLQCERGAENITVVVNPASPHLIEGLLLKLAH